ncbi:hypothetical protein K466DRAFT_607528 [Polyporus arcularius HHB13444]|uniref:Ribosomal RNA methyltransferase FtsJ domain-containing protein n=1 Tax=Polyporus arcularius HHB13444 TaxID=1314778 RepID=A0A5C3NL36_9APHY|nr:hypothetical protein K466DRAFT_607528 [Polyporus arcularius HHB13444]
MAPLTEAHSSPPTNNFRLGASQILARRDVPELQELMQLREKGWSASDLDLHFKTQREVADNATLETERGWYRNMKRIMEELDKAAEFVPSSTKFKFLDVGCAPGGFSSYILQKNFKAKGTGIYLPESAGGHPMLLEKRQRYKHLPQDLLQYDCSPTSGDEVSLDSRKRLPLTFIRTFSIVVLDGHALRTYQHHFEPTPGPDVDMLNAAHGAYRDRLLITQMFIALQSVALSGTIVMRLSHSECFPALQLLYLLDSVSNELVVHKPQTMHKVRGTSYVIAKGVCSFREQVNKGALYVRGLQTLWSQLQQGGPYDGIGRMIVEGDLDFVASTETLLDQYVDRLVELGLQTWATQIAGLRTLFERRRIQ